MRCRHLKKISASVNLAECIVQVGQIATDAWSSQSANSGEKIVNACVNLPDGGSTFLGVKASQGESHTAEYLAQALTELTVKVRLPCIYSSLFVLTHTF